ncbi:hypothetical protein SteCoe_6657 [Stentor coeruleus]|uniref:Uncharacterized protein n=1 Tax=Stentor coeruleus TaxID=5963 RepID=A0A1R2CPH2_9CILI|nr:hypothetical protein SteCoe_6657 [Stentor coeruleus]
MDSRDDFSQSLKDFRKVIRRPSNTPNKYLPHDVKSINIYRSSKKLSCTTKLNSTSIFPSRFNQTCEPKLLQSFNQSTFLTNSTFSNTSFKIHSKKPSNLPETRELQVKHSIFHAKTPINMEKLTSLSQKESIIFNQVKNLALPQPKPKVQIQVKQEPMLLRVKKHKVFVNRLSTLRKAQEEKEAENDEQGQTEEVKETTDEIGLDKRKPMKERVWCWKGADGDVVY